MQEQSIHDRVFCMLDEARARAHRSKGGMEKYLNTLEDSDDFHDEAFANGEVEALEGVMRMLNHVAKHNDSVIKRRDSKK